MGGLRTNNQKAKMFYRIYGDQRGDVFYNDNRRSGVDEIYNIVKQGIKIVQGLESDKFYCKKYIELLPKVIEGINNYKKTYSDDSYMQSRCNVIINGIQSIKK